MIVCCYCEWTLVCEIAVVVVEDVVVVTPWKGRVWYGGVAFWDESLCRVKVKSSQDARHEGGVVPGNT